jgi:hypothetical protein
MIVSVVQLSPSSGQVAGQVLGGSHDSPASTTPLPHIAEQSPSLEELHPEGQHMSPAAQAAMGALEHERVQSLTFPEVESDVQAFKSSQLARHAPGLPAVIPLSHASPGSCTPLPQTAAQSPSETLLQVDGQQASPDAQVVMALGSHRALQSADEPVSPKVVHPLAGGQEVGQAPAAPAAMALSQFSDGPSTIPLPQTTGQSASRLWLPPVGQQPSPPTKSVMAGKRHVALQVPADWRSSRVQARPSEQVCGQAPAAPGAIPVSQVSGGSTVPLPQLAEQSESDM